jgi:hypothetical protein
LERQLRVRVAITPKTAIRAIMTFSKHPETSFTVSNFPVMKRAVIAMSARTIRIATRQARRNPK